MNIFLNKFKSFKVILVLILIVSYILPDNTYAGEISSNSDKLAPYSASELIDHYKDALMLFSSNKTASGESPDLTEIQWLIEKRGIKVFMNSWVKKTAELLAREMIERARAQIESKQGYDLSDIERVLTDELMVWAIGNNLPYNRRKTLINAIHDAFRAVNEKDGVERGIKILENALVRPEPEEVRDLSDDDILEAARRVLGLDEDEFLKTSQREALTVDLPYTLPYLEKIVSHIAESRIDDYGVVLLAGRDAELLYDALRTVFEGTDHYNKIKYFPASEPLLTAMANTRDMDQLIEYLAQFGLTEEFIRKRKKALFIDTGFLGNAGKDLNEIMKRSGLLDGLRRYDTQFTKQRWMDIRLLAADIEEEKIFDRFSVGPLLELEEIGGVAPETKIKQLAEFETFRESFATPGFYLACILQLIPHFTGHYEKLIRREDGRIIAVASAAFEDGKDVVRLGENNHVNTSVVDPVTAILAQRAVVDHFRDPDRLASLRKVHRDKIRKPGDMFQMIPSDPFTSRKLVVWDFDDTVYAWANGRHLCRNGIEETMRSLSSRGAMNIITTRNTADYVGHELRLAEIKLPLVNVYGIDRCTPHGFDYEGKLYKEIALSLGLNTEEAAGRHMVIVGNDQGLDMPLDLEGVVFIHLDKWDIPAKAVEQVISLLDEAGENNFNRGFRRMYNSARLIEDDYRRLYRAGPVVFTLEYRRSKTLAPGMLEHSALVPVISNIRSIGKESGDKNGGPDALSGPPSEDPSTDAVVTMSAGETVDDINDFVRQYNMRKELYPEIDEAFQDIMIIVNEKLKVVSDNMEFGLKHQIESVYKDNSPIMTRLRNALRKNVVGVEKADDIAAIIQKERSGSCKKRKIIFIDNGELIPTIKSMPDLVPGEDYCIMKTQNASLGPNTFQPLILDAYVLMGVGVLFGKPLLFKLGYRVIRGEEVPKDILENIIKRNADTNWWLVSIIPRAIRCDSDEMRDTDRIKQIFALSV